MVSKKLVAVVSGFALLGAGVLPAYAVPVSRHTDTVERTTTVRHYSNNRPVYYRHDNSGANAAAGLAIGAIFGATIMAIASSNDDDNSGDYWHHRHWHHHHHHHHHFILINSMG